MLLWQPATVYCLLFVLHLTWQINSLSLSLLLIVNAVVGLINNLTRLCIV